MGNQTGLTIFDYPYLYCKPTQSDIALKLCMKCMIKLKSKLFFVKSTTTPLNLSPNRG